MERVAIAGAAETERAAAAAALAAGGEGVDTAAVEVARGRR